MSINLQAIHLSTFLLARFTFGQAARANHRIGTTQMSDGASNLLCYCDESG